MFRWTCRCGFRTRMDWLTREDALRGLFHHQAFSRCARLPGEDEIYPAPERPGPDQRARPRR